LTNLDGRRSFIVFYLLLSSPLGLIRLIDCLQGLLSWVLKGKRPMFGFLRQEKRFLVKSLSVLHNLRGSTPRRIESNLVPLLADAST
jgi:hypothetical protein